MADFCKLLMGGCPPSPPQGKAKTCAKRVNKNELCWKKKIKKNKPDRIKRNTLCMDYSGGGVKMSDIKTQISALKLTWLKRLIQNPNSDYHLLCTYNIKSLEKLLHMGSLYCAKIIDKTSKKIWVDILYKWKRLLYNQMGSAQSCLTCPLWYNPKSSKETLFLPQCYRVGIIYLIDLCNREGNMLEEVRKNYHVNLHFLDYYRLQSDIGKLKKTQGANSQNLIPEKPIWPATLSLIHKSKERL